MSMNENEKEHPGCIAGLLIAAALFCGFCTLCVGSCAGVTHMEKQAVDNGHAHYYVDDNLHLQWEWLAPCDALEAQLDEATRSR